MNELLCTFSPAAYFHYFLTLFQTLRIGTQRFIQRIKLLSSLSTAGIWQRLALELCRHLFGLFTQTHVLYCAWMPVFLSPLIKRWCISPPFQFSPPNSSLCRWVTAEGTLMVAARLSRWLKSKLCWQKQNDFLSQWVCIFVSFRSSARLCLSQLNLLHFIVMNEMPNYQHWWRE